MKRIIVMVTMSLLGSSCYVSNTYVTSTPMAQSTYAEAERGKAVVHFLLPGRGNMGNVVSIYDGEKYIGSLTADQILTYQAVPGKRHFMGYFINKSQADFLSADLEAGKKYYVYLRFRSWAGYGLVPLNTKGESDELIRKANNPRTAFVIPNEKGFTWDRENHEEIMQVKEEYLKKWNSKPDDEKPYLGT